MKSPLKIVTWNVNGIRSVSDKGLLEYVKSEKPDVLCVQEVKAFEGQVAPLVRTLGGEYQGVWRSARKPGYSGVATFYRNGLEPTKVESMGIDAFDDEGRFLSTDFGDFVLINTYFPNSQREAARLPYKLDFCNAILKKMEDLRKSGRHLVLCGDYNISHRAIDLKNPKANEKNAGYLPEERAWMDELIDRAKYVDVFRSREPGPGHYTWWSYRPGIRERNIGWRLDYHVVNPEFESAVKSCVIRADVKGSDHCPVVLELN